MTERRRPRSRLRERNLLRNPLPLIAVAVTIFLVVLTLLAARLTTTSGLKGTSPQTTTVASGSGGQVRTIVRTTASGRTIVTKVAANGAKSTTSKQAPLATRTSGGERDD